MRTETQTTNGTSDVARTATLAEEKRKRAERTARKLIDEALGNGMDADSAGEYAVGAIPPKHLRQYARPLFVTIARQMDRIRARKLEDFTIGGEYVADGEEGAENLVILRQQLATSTFSLPDGSRVSWEDATDEQHHARAQWQLGRSSSIREDADRHFAAARLIARKGVSSLGEIEGWSEALEKELQQ